MESTTKRADLKDFVIRRLNLTDKDYEYMTDMGWSRNSEFATRFTFEQASTIRRCSDNIGYQQIVLSTMEGNMFSINPLDWQKDDGCLFASAINSWFEASKKKDDTCFEWRWMLDGEGECICSGTANTLEEAAEIANKEWHDELCIYLTEEKTI